MMIVTPYHHVQLDDAGVAWIEGTQSKVIELVVERLAYDWDADQLHSQHPHLELSQIHSALAYYYDHQTQFEQEIDQRLARIDQTSAAQGHSAIRAKLKARRL